MGIGFPRMHRSFLRSVANACEERQLLCSGVPRLMEVGEESRVLDAGIRPPREVRWERCSASPLAGLSPVPLPQPQHHREGQVDPAIRGSWSGSAAL